MSDTKALVSLGSGATGYKFGKKANPKLLESFKNQHPTMTYLVPFKQERDEFTSLCPKTGQPDHASIEIVYVPDKLCVESKSLKLYLMSYRMSGEFHEDVCNRICKDLIKLLEPKYIRVYGDFASRGGLAIKPMIAHIDLNKVSPEEEELIHNLIQSWDIKSK